MAKRIEPIRCPHCNHVLSDEWMRHYGATALGRTGGDAKARSYKDARAAAVARWREKSKGKLKK